MKHIPNYLSLSRTIFSLILFFIKPLSTAFYVIYMICGFSDIADGFIARKTGTSSKFGAKLDSAGDMIMDIVLLIKLYPIVNPSTKIIVWIILIAFVRFSSIIITVKKYKTFASIHTYSNKATGVLLFIFPMLIFHIPTNMLLYIICTAASISAIEELIIELTSTTLQLDKKSILMK
ncbi:MULTISPECIES: CDP-alcohol phosphatidyltransferase family protein [Clostridium]|uniref:CDP-alcohol phosphatidyltransferase family protein n=1 Tax=Clostridium TaxID=1485 RepID=UPI00069E3648|nr:MULTISPECIES: CDP-alcohol phosphatidyltransferase family protein [Clostridium]KOF56602.1 phosphatidylglycerophosphate synthase [Clostridium sp. DMHC 10]MCD2345607.1 CDP-alcohol phosphatidyltransferase family protein [Clostridium guangxiense]